MQRPSEASLTLRRVKGRAVTLFGIRSAVSSKGIKSRFEPGNAGLQLSTIHVHELTGAI